MLVTILTSSERHPVFPFLRAWAQDQNSQQHSVEIITRPDQASGGDYLFMISCGEIVTASVRDRYEHALVVHASDLPRGRGWSPQIWQILEGEDSVTVTLLEAEHKVDSGKIWLQESVFFEGHELYDEINKKIFEATLSLMSRAIKEAGDISPRQQEGTATFYKKRTPQDSELDINSSLIQLFKLLRVCDPDRYPAYFDHLGYRYKLKIEKMEKDDAPD